LREFTVYFRKEKLKKKEEKTTTTKIDLNHKRWGDFKSPSDDGQFSQKLNIKSVSLPNNNGDEGSPAGEGKRETPFSLNVILIKVPPLFLLVAHHLNELFPDFAVVC
jgi:hypothetical protein